MHSESFLTDSIVILRVRETHVYNTFLNHILRGSRLRVATIFNHTIEIYHSIIRKKRTKAFLSQ